MITGADVQSTTEKRVGMYFLAVVEIGLLVTVSLATQQVRVRYEAACANMPLGIYYTLQHNRWAPRRRCGGQLAMETSFTWWPAGGGARADTGKSSRCLWVLWFAVETSFTRPAGGGARANTGKSSMCFGGGPGVRRLYDHDGHTVFSARPVYSNTLNSILRQICSALLCLDLLCSVEVGEVGRCCVGGYGHFRIAAAVYNEVWEKSFCLHAFMMGDLDNDGTCSDV
ncbi:hypothetical protein EDC01DRAFT_645607, partial [Geopyxis carbonaria]